MRKTKIIKKNFLFLYSIRYQNNFSKYFYKKYLKNILLINHNLLNYSLLNLNHFLINLIKTNGVLFFVYSSKEIITKLFKNLYLIPIGKLSKGFFTNYSNSKIFQQNPKKIKPPAAGYFLSQVDYYYELNELISKDIVTLGGLNLTFTKAIFNYFFFYNNLSIKSYSFYFNLLLLNIFLGYKLKFLNITQNLTNYLNFSWNSSLNFQLNSRAYSNLFLIKYKRYIFLRRELINKRILFFKKTTKTKFKKERSWKVPSKPKFFQLYHNRTRFKNFSLLEQRYYPKFKELYKILVKNNSNLNKISNLKIHTPWPYFFLFNRLERRFSKFKQKHSFKPKKRFKKRKNFIDKEKKRKINYILNALGIKSK